MISIKKILNKLFNLELYTSPTDQFLAEYQHAHPGCSHSQRKEKEKFHRIFNQRDHAEADSKPDKFWNKF